MALSKLRWVVLLLALLPGAAHAQGELNTGGSVQVNTGGPAQNSTYGDVFSSGCIQGQKPNIWKQLGVNPLTCHPQTMAQDSQGQCTLKGANQVAHQGTTCYYCVPEVPPGDIYIPMDQVENASKQGYLCGESPVDPDCMSVCTKEFPQTTTYIPPTAQPVTGGGGPLTASASTDPCHPYYDLSTAAGRAAMQANAAKDAAACNEERCKHNPTLEVCKTPAPALQGKGGTQAPPQPTATQQACPVSIIGWTQQQKDILGAALDKARQMLVAAKKQTDAKLWDPKIKDLAKKYYGNDSTTTESTLSSQVTKTLALLDTLDSVEANIYPDRYRGMKTTPVKSDWLAYVEPTLTPGTSPSIFITQLFWKQPTTGPDSQAAVMVHELSHFPLAAGTNDAAYGEVPCQFLGWQASLDGNKFAGLIAKKPTVPLNNADSFEYFVYYASQAK